MAIPHADTLLALRAAAFGLLGGHVAPTPWRSRVELSSPRRVQRALGGGGGRGEEEDDIRAANFVFPIASSISSYDIHNTVCLPVKIPISSFITYTMYVGTQVSYCNT